MKLLPAMAAAVLFSGFCATLLAYQGLIFEVSYFLASRTLDA